MLIPAVPDLPKKRVVLLGATGSIGESTLRVLAAHRNKLELVGVAARSNAKRLAEIAREFPTVRHAALFEAEAYAAAKSAGFPANVSLHQGTAGLVALSQLPESDIVLIAVVGTTGLEPALAALAAGKDLALASKEILVLAGKFVMAAAKKSGGKLLPVDSEHNAVFQCLQGHRSAEVKRLVLTASGGAFRDWPLEKLATAKPEDALKHPNWDMGPKITIDCATMANKGLELIEAQWLFGLRPEQCQAVLHTQSLVHCIIEFSDGAMLTHLCPASMTFPIQHALLYPERAPTPTVSALSLERAFSLDFQPVDETRYPMLRLAKAAMASGGVAPAIYNAANEIAVAGFLEGQIPFLAIPRVVEHTLDAIGNFEPADLAAVLGADAEARRVAQEHLKKTPLQKPL
jgi:1-deoxy-D-xylulose-5-phosphate reductoisomerase